VPPAPTFAYFFAAVFFAGAALSAGFSSATWSPSMLLAGQTEKTGHFLQPATMAIGQTVMMNSDQVGVAWFEK
jgi:hypothetical protein